MSYDAFESQLREQTARWSPPQAVLFITLLAERGLQRYREAAADSPDLAHFHELRGALNLVWHGLEGALATTAQLRAAQARVELATPHLDDIERPDALAACVQVTNAVLAAVEGDGAAHGVEQAIMTEMIGALTDWVEEEAQPALWSTAQAQHAAAALRQLADTVSNMPVIDAASLRTLRTSRG